MGAGPVKTSANNCAKIRENKSCCQQCAEPVRTKVAAGNVKNLERKTDILSQEVEKLRYQPGYS